MADIEWTLESIRVRNFYTLLQQTQGWKGYYKPYIIWKHHFPSHACLLRFWVFIFWETLFCGIIWTILSVHHALCLFLCSHFLYWAYFYKWWTAFYMIFNEVVHLPFFELLKGSVTWYNFSYDFQSTCLGKLNGVDWWSGHMIRFNNWYLM